jgi:AhpD family alkylhydroperoxidase
MENIKIEKGFDKRIFTFKEFVKDFTYLIVRCPCIIKTVFFSKEISKIFREKIMTIVTAINGCTYCSWFHAKVAVNSGMSINEVKEMMNLQFDTKTNDKELIALLYAQHFTETNRKPDKTMETKLIETYGKRTANQIKLIIRIMFFTNLQGNTFDAFISRLKGTPAKNSNVLFEFFFFLINALFILPVKPFVNNKINNE